MRRKEMKMYKVKNAKTAMAIAWNQLMDSKGITEERESVYKNKKKRPFKKRRPKRRSAMEGEQKTGTPKGRKNKRRSAVAKKQETK